MLPNLADDSGLDVYEFRLLVHYYRVGDCWQSTTTTADACNISRSQVVAKRQSLAKKGWITIKRGNAQDSLVITIVDKWDENHKKYMGVKLPDPPHIANEPEASPPPDHLKVGTWTRGGQDMDSNNTPIKNNPVKNIKDSPISEILYLWAQLFPNKPQPRSVTYAKKAEARFRDPAFREKWREAMTAASKSPSLHTESWFGLEFFLRNDENWQKCLDGWMDWKDKQAASPNGRVEPSAKDRLERRLARYGER